jgi:excinuclease UvrABC ATPase subunit
MDSINIRGARVHNLKNIDVSIPRNKLVVITGLSGSGKSSLAFDTMQKAKEGMLSHCQRMPGSFYH